jgi:hypothetical protein
MQEGLLKFCVLEVIQAPFKPLGPFAIYLVLEEFLTFYGLFERHKIDTKKVGSPFTE